MSIPFMAMSAPPQPPEEPVIPEIIPEPEQLIETVPQIQENTMEQNTIETETEQIAPAHTEVIAEKPVVTAPAVNPNAIFQSTREKTAFFFFVSPVLILSFVSMLHLVAFFGVGNGTLQSYLLAGAFELSSMATLVAIVLLRKISKWTLWAILLLLYVLQMLGNVYSAFDSIDPAKSKSFFQFMFLDPNSLADHRIAAIILGGILSTVALLLTKILTNYLAPSKTQ